MQRWLASRDGTVVAAVTTWLRPDDRTFLSFGGGEPAAIGPLADAVCAELPRAVYTTVEEADAESVKALQGAGFTTEVVGERFRIRFDRALAALERARIPSGFSIHPADTVDEDRLFALDNTIRHDVPGTDGWRGDRRWFHEELIESPPFDPEAYLVAIEDRTGDYAGLVRIWRNPTGPRFGLIGVVRQHRGSPVAAALLEQALSAASHWGQPTFVTETSPQNAAVYPRMRRIGAESEGRFLQLVRR